MNQPGLRCSEASVLLWCYLYAIEAIWGNTFGLLIGISLLYAFVAKIVNIVTDTNSDSNKRDR